MVFDAPSLSNCSLSSSSSDTIAKVDLQLFLAEILLIAAVLFVSLLARCCCIRPNNNNNNQFNGQPAYASDPTDIETSKQTQ